MGEYQRKETIDGKEYPVGDPVPGYYPSVIDENVFQAAQEARQRNLATGRGRKGQLITNLFAGLLSCSYCGGPVKFHSNGNSKSLLCEGLLEGKKCFRFGWSYSDFENSFFDFMNETGAVPNFPAVFAKLQAGKHNQSQGDIYGARAEIVQILKARVLKLTIASAGMPPPSISPKGLIRRDHPKTLLHCDLL